jgi:tripartite-type tricarboxylate transporter receptor subunit TctC
MKSHVICLLAALLAATVSAPTHSQAYPERPVRLIVGIQAGGGIDILARAVAAPLSEALHQQIVIDNRPGAGNLLAAKIAATAAADGYTLYMGTIASHGINPVLRRDVGYDPIKDFAPISMTAVAENVLVVTPSFPATTLSEFINYAKANPGKIFYSSPGVGSSIHLTMELIALQTKTKMVHVPYKGSVQIAIVSGEVQAACANLASSLQFFRSGKLRPLAISSKTRNSHVPDVPTFIEAGLPLEVVVWYALFAPAGVPQPVVTRLNSELAKVLQTPEVMRRLDDLGFTAKASTPQELGTWVRGELKRWQTVVNAAGIKVE